MQLHEKWRPKTLDAVVGQDAAVRKCRALLANGAGGQAFFVSGPSGGGKSTIAHILAETIADGDCIVEIAGDDLTVDRLRKFLEDSELLGLIGSAKTGWAMIVNETHGIRADVIRRLLVVLGDKPIRKHVCWIFTTTTEGADLFGDKIDAAPFLSRCQEISLTNQGLCAAFAEHVQRIARAEGLDGQPLTEYVKLARKCQSNCRAMLQAVAASELKGEDDAS